jgi:epsin
MSKVIRGVKNVTKGYSSVQVKVRDGRRWPLLSRYLADKYIATSNDAWGPTGTQMSDIAAMTFNGYAAALLIIDAGANSTELK